MSSVSSLLAKLPSHRPPSAPPWTSSAYSTLERVNRQRCISACRGYLSGLRRPSPLSRDWLLRLKLSWGVVLSRTGRELPRPNLALFLGAAYLLWWVRCRNKGPDPSPQLVSEGLISDGPPQPRTPCGITKAIAVAPLQPDNPPYTLVVSILGTHLINHLHTRFCSGSTSGRTWPTLSPLLRTFPWF